MDRRTWIGTMLAGISGLVFGKNAESKSTGYVPVQESVIVSNEGLTVTVTTSNNAAFGFDSLCIKREPLDGGQEREVIEYYEKQADGTNRLLLRSTVVVYRQLDKPWEPEELEGPYAKIGRDYSRWPKPGDNPDRVYHHSATAFDTESGGVGWTVRWERVPDSNRG